MLSVLYTLIQAAFAPVSIFPGILTRHFLKGPHRTLLRASGVTSPGSSHRASPSLSLNLSREHMPSSNGLSTSTRGTTLLHSFPAHRRPRHRAVPPAPLPCKRPSGTFARSGREISECSQTLSLALSPTVLASLNERSPCPSGTWRAYTAYHPLLTYPQHGIEPVHRHMDTQVSWQTAPPSLTGEEGEQHPYLSAWG